MSQQNQILALIVNDDRQVKNRIIEALYDQNIHSIEANNGKQALEHLENHNVDFVIADAHMKMMDGMQFVKIIHRNHKHIPVVMTLANEDNETLVNAFRAGAMNVLRTGKLSEELNGVVLPIIDLIEKRKNRTFDYNSIQHFTEELRLENDNSMIPIVVEHLIHQLKETGFSSRVSGLEVALYEMLANAIEHGNLEITNDEKEAALIGNKYNELLNQRRNHPELKHRQVCIVIHYNPRRLTFTITDEGDGFNVEKFTNLKGFDPLAQSGRGILLSRMYCDEINYNNRGNKVQLILKAESELDKEGIIQTQTPKSLNPKVLVVDNNPQMLRHISTLLTRTGFSYGYIAHSDHLFPRLEDEVFDLILLEVNMPKIDGITLLKKLKDHNLFKDIPVIMLTSDKNDRLMAECFAVGAKDFIVKPVNELALKSRIASTLAQQETLKQIEDGKIKLEQLNTRLQDQNDLLSKIKNELSIQNEQIKEDIRLAQKIQKNILSSNQNFGFLSTHLVFKPRELVSGDFFYQDKDREGNVIVFVGDATGHGVSSAFLTMLVRMAFGMTDLSAKPIDIMKGINRQLSECVPRGDHMTGQLLKISAGGCVVGCNAGGPPCLHFSQGKTVKKFFEEGGPALGMFGDERIPFEEKAFRLSKGDKILVFTDGILESRNQAGNVYGLDSVVNYVSKNLEESADKTVAGLHEDVVRFCANQQLEDDLTVMLIDYFSN